MKMFDQAEWIRESHWDKSEAEKKLYQLRHLNWGRAWSRSIVKRMVTPPWFDSLNPRGFRIIRAFTPDRPLVGRDKYTPTAFISDP